MCAFALFAYTYWCVDELCATVHAFLAQIACKSYTSSFCCGFCVTRVCVCVCEAGEWASLNKTERDRKRQRERERPPGAWSAATWWRLKRPREGFLFFSPSLQIGLCDRPTSLFFCSNTRLQLWASVISELKVLKVCFIILVAKQLKVWQHLGSCLISCGWLLSANTVEQVCILWLCLLWGSNISTSSEHTSFRCSKADW